MVSFNTSDEYECVTIRWAMHAVARGQPSATPFFFLKKNKILATFVSTTYPQVNMVIPTDQQHYPLNQVRRSQSHIIAVN